MSVDPQCQDERPESGPHASSAMTLVLNPTTDTYVSGRSSWNGGPGHRIEHVILEMKEPGNRTHDDRHDLLWQVRFQKDRTYNRDPQKPEAWFQNRAARRKPTR